MAEKDKTPEIRFTGFTYDWEQRKLCDIANKVTEKNVSMEYSENFTNSAEYGIVTQRDYFDHDISNSDNIGGYYVVRNEDFVYNPRISSFAPVGPINRNKLGRTGVMSPLYSVFRTHDIDNTFLEQFFKSKSWHAFMRLNGDSGARSDRFSIKDSIFVEMPIPYPSAEEQVAIGRILTTIDYLITLHQRKYDKLVIVKKSMLEKMFPKDGANVPEIRLTGFTDAWEQCKVCELFKVTRGNVLAATETCEKQTENMQYPVYSSQTKNDGLMGYFKEYLFENAITWTTDGANAGTVNYRPGKFYSTNVNGVLLSNEGYANKTIAEALNKVAWKHVSHVGNPKLMNNVMSEISISIPSLVEEQMQIAVILDSLDNLITLHQRELEKLKNIKKSMLEKMFV